METAVEQQILPIHGNGNQFFKPQTFNTGFGVASSREALKPTHPIMIFSKKLLAVLFSISSIHAADSVAEESSARQCFENKKRNYSEVLACYRQAHASLPLTFTRNETNKSDGIEKRSYELISQKWSPNMTISPDKWSHSVEIHIPDNTVEGRALLIINNGINHAVENNPARKPNDVTEEVLQAIAKKTRMAVISISNVPNQYLQFENDVVPKREDDIVAYSWKLFLEAPESNPFISLHIPMMEAAVKAMDLAEKELKQWNIRSFVVAGASKRGWTAWHTAIADPRVDAIVPFVIDVLNTRKVLDHTYEIYGKNWPLALRPYHREGITGQRNTDNFEKLMKIEDPLLYLDTAYADRLRIPKYMINASGDSFFAPDNANLYFDKLPGIKSLRSIPNSDHYGVGRYTEQSLVTFINRLQSGTGFPTLGSKLVQGAESTKLSVRFSETPVEVTKWTAVNPVARDFRHACGIRYEATALEPASNQELAVSIEKPAEGWIAVFVEARFPDGFVATTPVYVLPESAYPTMEPPSKEPACKTISAKIKTPS